MPPHTPQPDEPDLPFEPTRPSQPHHDQWTPPGSQPGIPLPPPRAPWDSTTPAPLSPATPERPATSLYAAHAGVPPKPRHSRLPFILFGVFLLGTLLSAWLLATKLEPTPESRFASAVAQNLDTAYLREDRTYNIEDEGGAGSIEVSGYNIVDLTDPARPKARLSSEVRADLLGQDKPAGIEMIITSDDYYTRHQPAGIFYEQLQPYGYTEETWLHADTVDSLPAQMLIDPFQFGRANTALGDIIIGQFDRDTRRAILAKIDELQPYVIQSHSVEQLDDRSVIRYDVRFESAAIRQVNTLIIERLGIDGQDPEDTTPIAGPYNMTLWLDPSTNRFVKASGNVTDGGAHLTSVREFSYPGAGPDITRPSTVIELPSLEARMMGEDFETTPVAPPQRSI